MGFQFFEDVYDLDDFVATTDGTVTDDEFRTVERIDVEEGEAVVIGQGNAANQTDAVGRIYLDPANGGGTTLEGKVRVVIENTQNIRQATLYQSTISAVNVGANSRADRRPLPRRQAQVREPYQLAIQVKLSSGTDTYDSSQSTAEIDGYRGEQMA